MNRGLCDSSQLAKFHRLMVTQVILKLLGSFFSSNLLIGCVTFNRHILEAVQPHEKITQLSQRVSLFLDFWWELSHDSNPKPADSSLILTREKLIRNHLYCGQTERGSPQSKSNLSCVIFTALWTSYFISCLNCRRTQLRSR